VHREGEEDEMNDFTAAAAPAPAALVVVSWSVTIKIRVGRWPMHYS